MIQSLTRSEDGQDLVEYGLLCTLIALACIASIQQIATCVTSIYNNISSSFA